MTHKVTTLEVKLASIAVHADELLEELGNDSHDWNAIVTDCQAIRGLLSDGEVQACLIELGQAALLPAKRRTT